MKTSLGAAFRIKKRGLIAACETHAFIFFDIKNVNGTSFSKKISLSLEELSLYQKSTQMG